MAEEKVLLEKKGYRAYIILNRPDKLNAVDMDIYRQINKYLIDLDQVFYNIIIENKITA